MKVDKMNRTMWVLGGAIAVVLVVIIVIAVLSISKNADQGNENNTNVANKQTEQQTEEAVPTPTPEPEQTDAPSTEEATPTPTEEPTPTPTEEPTTENQTVLSVIYSEDFEDAAHDFVSRGTELLELTEDAHDSAYALRVINRTNTWNGPKVPMDAYMEAGKSYYVEAWAKFESDTDTTDTLQISLQYNNAEGEKYNTIAFDTATVGEWIKLSGYVQVPEDSTGGVYVYLESNGTNYNNLYLDDFKVAVE